MPLGREPDKKQTPVLLVTLWGGAGMQQRASSDRESPARGRTKSGLTHAASKEIKTGSAMSEKSDSNHALLLYIHVA